MAWHGMAWHGWYVCGMLDEDSKATATGPELLPLHGGQFEYRIPREYKLPFGYVSIVSQFPSHIIL
jgi:hypothetical protein